MLRLLQRRDGLGFRYGGKIVQEIGEWMPTFEVVEECLNRHSCTDKDGGPAENLGIAMDDVMIAHSCSRRAESITRHRQRPDLRCL